MNVSSKQINLLPKPAQQQLQLRQWFLGIVRLAVLGGGGVLLLLVLFGGVWWYVSAEEASYAKEAEQLRALAALPENATIKNEVKAANNAIADYTKLSLASLSWSKFVRAFAVVVPDGVQVQNLSVDGAKKLVTISGFASKREAVIALYNNINSSPSFEKVNYPLENISRPANVAFTFTFTIKDGVLEQAQSQ